MRLDEGEPIFLKTRRLTQILALPAALGITLTTGTSAQAHYVYFAEQVWSNADTSLCLWNYSETSHGSTGGGYFKGESKSQADIDANPLDCILQYRRNVGDLGEWITVYKWYVDSQGQGDWIVCDRSEKWTYNSVEASILRLQWTAPAGGLCGSGYYGIMNFATMRDSGQWVGQNVYNWSGQHLLPDNSFAAAGGIKAPGAPSWISNKGLNKIPTELPQADSDGKPIKDRNGKQVMVDPSPPEPDGKDSAAGEKRTKTTDKNGNVTETVSIGKP
ncbi:MULTISPECIES: hypothetical protein [Streptomyces]|uniref:hypothetical protein n=1 Tax=Streptomyces TaxID=1883 RepID=UPI0015C681B6|nr:MULTISPECIES: hypothetical protein [Streptomyces]MCX4657557.1 hypothetical protein [Streptomyces microflavus]